jgi:hypothetical protein
MGVKFAHGTFARIAAVLREGENKMSFVRDLVMREVERREAEQPAKPARRRSTSRRKKTAAKV